MSEGPLKSLDMFENGYFWELYKDLERQFENYLEYVPFIDGNEGVHSFKLLNLIVSIGGYVDSAFKEMAKYPRFSANEECGKILERLEAAKISVQKGERPVYPSIKLCLTAFEKEYKLSLRKILFKKLDKREYMTPFKPYNPETHAPYWWDIYNGLKHELGMNFKEASLKNTLKALAGAFLLNVIHEPSVLRLFRYGTLRIGTQAVTGPDVGIRVKDYLDPAKSGLYALRFWLENKKEFDGVVETPLFVYDYREPNRYETST